MKLQKIIEAQQLKINELKSQINNISNNNYSNSNIINSLKNEINIKDKEIQKLTQQLSNYKNNSSNNENVKRGELMCINFTSTNQKVNYAIPCVATDIFAEVEEKLYREYPEYRETNNSFIANGIQVLRFKTVAENNIGNGRPVILLVPS